jgi:hypothetical protein
MAVVGRYLWSRRLLACAAVAALFAAPAHAFFFPKKPAITVPTFPVTTGKGTHSGGGTTGGGTTGGGTTGSGGGTTVTPQTAPEPSGLLLALLGGGGAGLFAACRRRRRKRRRARAAAKKLPRTAPVGVCF